MTLERKKALSRRKKALFSLITMFVIFGSAEVSLRLLGVPKEKYAARRFFFPPEHLIGKAFDWDRTLFWTLVPGFDGAWTLRKLSYTFEARIRPVNEKMRAASYPDREYFDRVTWEINGNGHRGPEQEQGQKTILFIGSSVTFGWGVKHEDCFAGLIGKKLEEGGHRGWAVLNHGVPGYSSYQCRKKLEELISDVKPAIIILEAGINDGVYAPLRSDKDLEFLNQGSFAGRVIECSNLTLWFYYLVNQRGEEGGGAVAGPPDRFYATSVYMPGRCRVEKEDFIANLAAVQELARNAGAEAYFIFPALYNEYGRGVLLKSANHTHPREIGLCDALKALEHADYFLPYDEAHLSLKGHELAADLIWKRFLEDGLF